MTASGVVGCAQLCLWNPFAGIQSLSEKMEALGFARGDARPCAQRGAKPRAGERGAFSNSLPFYMLGAAFVFGERAKRKGKKDSFCTSF